MFHWDGDVYLPFGSSVYVVTVSGNNEGEEPGVFVRLKNEPPLAWVKHQAPPAGADAIRRATNREEIIFLCRQANQAAVYRDRREFPGLTFGMIIKDDTMTSRIPTTDVIDSVQSGEDTAMEGSLHLFSSRQYMLPSNPAAPSLGKIPPGGRRSQIYAEPGMNCYDIMKLEPDALLVNALYTFTDVAHANETPISASSHTLNLSDSHVAASLKRLRKANLMGEERDPPIVILAAWMVEYMATPSPVKGKELRRTCFGLLRHLLHELSVHIGRSQLPPDESTPDAVFLKSIPTLSHLLLKGSSTLLTHLSDSTSKVVMLTTKSIAELGCDSEIDGWAPSAISADACIQPTDACIRSANVATLVPQLQDPINDVVRAAALLFHVRTATDTPMISAEFSILPILNPTMEDLEESCQYFGSIGLTVKTIELTIDSIGVTAKMTELTARVLEPTNQLMIIDDTNEAFTAKQLVAAHWMAKVRDRQPVCASSELRWCIGVLRKHANAKPLRLVGALGRMFADALLHHLGNGRLHKRFGFQLRQHYRRICKLVGTKELISKADKTASNSGTMDPPSPPSSPPSAEYVICTDACDIATGGVLLQEQHPSGEEVLLLPCPRHLLRPDTTSARTSKVGA